MREQRCEGTSDTSLTKLGKAQALKIARHLSEKHIDGIVSSRLHRATQCAKILRQFIPHKIHRDERLNDMNLGVWHGKFPEEIESRYPELWKAWRDNPATSNIPEAEAFSDVKNRVERFLEDYNENALFPKLYLVSTHDIIIRIIVNSILNTIPADFWSLELHPGSITEVHVFPEKKVVEINNTNHLYV